MKKWQEWTIVAGVGLLMVAAIGAGYWFITEEKQVPLAVETQSDEEKDLTAVDSELSAVDDLDLSSLDAIDEDLQAVDLTNL
jgi:hypothetical protein